MAIGKAKSILLSATIKLNQQSNSIKLQMIWIKKLQLIVFQKMYNFQKGNMSSSLAFIIYQILKCSFKDIFIITMLVFPLEIISNRTQRFFQIMDQYNTYVTVLLGVIMGLFMFMFLSKLKTFQEKFKIILQIFLPWIDIFAFSVVSVQILLLITNMKNNILLAAFNILTIISVSFIHIFYNLFNFTKQPRSKNLFKKRQARIVSLSNIILLILIIYISIRFFSQPLSTSQKMIYSILQLFLSLVKIKEKVIRQHYLNDFSQSVSSIFFFVQIGFGLITTMIYSFGMTLLQTNMIFIVVLIASLSYSGLNSYNIHKKALMFLSNASNLKSQDEALMYIDRMCELISKVQKEQDDVILASLKKRHSLACRNDFCECQNKDVNINTFTNSYVKSEIQQMSRIYHNSPFILISILYFKMAVFKYYPQVLAKLSYLSSHFNLTITERYYRYCLSQYVIEFINKRNYQINAVESQHMFKLQQIRGQLETMIKGDIQTRSKTWKYLSRGLCRVSQLQNNCNSSLKYISKISLIYQTNKVKFKKSKQFNLLLLFYFIKVSFINSGKDIRQNLKQLYFGYKQDQLYNIKQFRRFIYHKRSCVIETLIDTKIMGIITGASRNVEDMFGFPNNKIIGLSINALMPPFMAEEHGPIMQQWSKSGTWRTIGKLKEVFCIHKQQYCFQALLYLKIYIKDNNMYFITNIFKLNQNDFLIINPNLKIQGLGRKFYKILGQPAKRMNLQLLIQNDGSMLNHQFSFNDAKIYRKIFMCLRNLQSEVDNYLQAVNLRFNDKQKNQLSSDFHKMLSNKCQQKYLVEFSIKKFKMGTISFLVLELKEAKRIQKQQTMKFIEKQQYQLPIVHGEISRDLLDFEAVQSEQNSFQKDQEDDQLIVDANANSSLASLSQKQNYPLTKTIEKFIKITQDPSNINDNRLHFFNYTMVFLLILLSSINFVSFYCYKEILLEIQGIFFADGAQSDVMQTTEIAYNAIYSLKSQIYNTTPQTFYSTLTSARLVNNYVYSLGQFNFQNLVKQVTQLTKQRLYSYLQKPSLWKTKESSTKISTFQFLENMFYLSGEIYNQLERVNKKPDKTINLDYFNQLFINFPQMQRLNQYYLTQYQGVSDYQHQFATYFIFISLALYFIVSLILSIIINRYLKFRFNQILKSFTFFSFIPSQFLQKMKQYYSLLITSLVEKEYLQSIDRHQDYVFQIDTYDLFHKNDVNKNGLSSKIKFINYENYYKWILVLLFFGLVNGINYLAAKQVISFFPSSKEVITEVNQLMRSENKLLQSYFYLRSTYSLNPQKYINIQLYQKLMQYLNQTTVKFDIVANKLVNVFNQYDPTYQSRFVETLVRNVCNLSSSDLSQFQNDKCINQLQLNILDGGILISMNFFQRNVRTCLEDFRLMYIQKIKQPYKGDYFLQIQFQEIDKMLIYMFKIYQQTQAISFTSYIVAIKIISNNYLQFILGISVFYVIIIILWLRSIPLQKENLSKLYGHLLLIPFAILKSNTRIAKSLKDSIQYTDS